MAGVDQQDLCSDCHGYLFECYKQEKLPTAATFCASSFFKSFLLYNLFFNFLFLVNFAVTSFAAHVHFSADQHSFCCLTSYACGSVEGPHTWTVNSQSMCQIHAVLRKSICPLVPGWSASSGVDFPLPPVLWDSLALGTPSRASLFLLLSWFLFASLYK